MALIEDVLDFSKIESGALTIEKGEVALRPLIEGVAELLSTRAHAKDMEIATAIAADVPHIVKLDGIRLRQVLMNLVGNAVKFTEEGGVLVAASIERPFAASAHGTLRIFVRDTGVGVPEDKQAHIFQDFVQADSSHARRFEGTGLGLSISKRLVEAMNGEIGMHAAEGKGSVFWVAIPLDDIKSIAVDAPLRGKQVALVSDSPILRAGLALQLSCAGAKILEMSFAAFARERVEPDLLLIDASKDEVQAFPDVSAFDLPAVALLMPGQRAQLAALSAKGYRAYLMKPVRQDSLEKRLASAIAGAAELETEASAPKADHLPRCGLAILLAEDNPVNALLARELLRRRGHSVREVTTGEGAVRACAEAHFDLVIMDVHMPGLDGIEATRRIRFAESQKKGAARLPIFALTADALETGRNACLEAGMDGFLIKPVDPAELDAVLAGVVPPVIVAAE
jgi:CheY-like chemotaxis protein